MVELKRITGSMENRIVTGLIVSDEFCKRVLPMLHKDYFESEYAAIIYNWTQYYFMKYKEAPGKNIQEIYKDRRGELEDATRSLVREFLASLSEKYKNDGGMNVEVEVDRAVEHVRKRSMEVHAEKLQKALDAGKIDKAEEEVEKFKQVRKTTSGWINPFDSTFIRSVLEDREGDLVFKFPGKLGELSKWHERGWLCAFLAPMKRGKSFMLQEVAVICALNRKKVVFFSLEMNAKKMGRRILNRITATDPDHEGDFLYPVFDCAANQDGTCKLPQRVNKVRLLLDSGEKPQIKEAAKYKPCTACRRTSDFMSYKVATWFTFNKRDRMTSRSASRKASGLQSMYGDNFRMKAYPMGAANLKHIRADLDALEYTEGFVPDAIVLDYADILAPEDARVSDIRHRLDATWQQLKSIAQERHCLVFTASQGTRKSIKKNLMEQEDIAEDIRKMAHIDLMYALNQTGKESAEGAMRISVVAHRHDEYNDRAFVTVLQQRGLAQMLLDSEIHWGPRQQDHFSIPIGNDDDD
jgi:hypothetical protein